MKIKLTVERGYRELDFEFKDYEAAWSFIKMFQASFTPEDDTDKELRYVIHGQTLEGDDF